MQGTESGDVRKAGLDGDLLAEEKFQKKFVACDAASGNLHEPIAQDAPPRRCEGVDVAVRLSLFS